MATYYVYPDATGANNGTSGNDAWVTFQTAVDTWSAGDIIYCRGTEILSAAINVDQAAGTAAAMVQVIGVNASGVDDGTKFVLDGNSAATNCMDGGKGHILWKNIECINSTGAGVDWGTTCFNQIFFRCSFSNTGNAGYRGDGFDDYSIFVQCKFNGNTGNGHYYTDFGMFFACTFNDNGGQGAQAPLSSYYIGCVSHNNTAAGLYSDQGMAISCVVDGNVDGITTAGLFNALFCRITNNTGDGLHLAAAGDRIVENWNGFFSNGANYDVVAGSLIQQLGDSAALAAAGYTDAASDDFSLTDTAEMRRVATTIGDA
jgi:hypothetical protein